MAWNASRSAPVGLYLVERRPTVASRLALIRLTPTIAALAAARGYLPTGVLLLKPIGARAGDHVCRLGRTILINGRPAAFVRPIDGAGRPMPRFTGCRRLQAQEFFVLGRSTDSFDSRYFGPVTADAVVGYGRPPLIIADW